MPGLATPSTSKPVAAASAETTCRNEQESRWTRYGSSAFSRGMKISDWASGYANAASAKLGGERFWPRSGDFELEIEKCERILRCFTVEGIESEEGAEEEVATPGAAPEARTETHLEKVKRKVIRKIPPALVARAQGIAIYTSMRSGIAPLGGSGGSGLVMGRLPDGSWSSPSFITPQNFAVGMLIGLDIFDVVLLINSKEAMEGFKSHKFTLGAETAIATGPMGAGMSMETGLKGTKVIPPIFSYVKSRGLYAGVEIMGQAFLTRFDENERVYHWPGIAGRDILEGKVRVPAVVAPLHHALHEAETGKAQGMPGGRPNGVVVPEELDTTPLLARLIPRARKRVPPPLLSESAIMHEEAKAGRSSSLDSLPPEPLRAAPAAEEAAEEGEGMELQEGERLHLPPTPEQLAWMEQAGIKDEEDLRWEQREREEVWALPKPPVHPDVNKYWSEKAHAGMPPEHAQVAPAPATFDEQRAPKQMSTADILTASASISTITPAGPALDIEEQDVPPVANLDNLTSCESEMPPYDSARSESDFSMSSASHAATSSRHETDDEQDVSAALDKHLSYLPSLQMPMQAIANNASRENKVAPETGGDEQAAGADVGAASPGEEQDAVARRAGVPPQNAVSAGVEQVAAEAAQALTAGSGEAAAKLQASPEIRVAQLPEAERSLFETSKPPLSLASEVVGAPPPSSSPSPLLSPRSPRSPLLAEAGSALGRSSSVRSMLSIDSASGRTPGSITPPARPSRAARPPRAAARALAGALDSSLSVDGPAEPEEATTEQH